MMRELVERTARLQQPGSERRATNMAARSPGCLLQEAIAGLFGGGWCCFRSLGLAETIAEAFDTATHVVHGFLRAGVERMGLAEGVQFVQRQFAAVFHLDHLFGIGARAGHEFESIGQVHEANFAVIGVDTIVPLFSFSCASRVGSLGKPLRNSKPGVLVA